MSLPREEVDEQGQGDATSDYESAEEDTYCSAIQFTDSGSDRASSGDSVARKLTPQSSNLETQRLTPQSSDVETTTAESAKISGPQHPPPASIVISENGDQSQNGNGNVIRLQNGTVRTKTTTSEDDHDNGGTCNTSSNCIENPTLLQNCQDHDDDGGDDHAAGSMEPDMAKENHNTIATSDDDDDEPEEDHSKSDQLDDDQFTSAGLRWYNPFRNFCGCIVNDERFQIFIVVLIVLNGLMMGIATYDFVEDDPQLRRAFEISDLAFLIVFTIECILQIGYHGYQVFMDGWLTFDLLVVVMSWSLDSVQIFRAIRVFRAFRLVARLEVLKELVNAIVAVLPRVGAIMVLFTLVLYIYSVLCTILFGDRRYGEDEVDYFGRIDYSLFTLFQMITLENWGQVVREVMAFYPWSHAIFGSFLAISAFILYSLIVAVVCDAVAVVEHPDIAVKNFERNMVKEKKKTRKRVRKMEKRLDELSQQQMDILLGVQNRLMNMESFRRDAFQSHVEASEEDDE